jgi:hypothetical protein
VIAELSSLSLDVAFANAFLSSELLMGDKDSQTKYVIKQAKATLDYLKVGFCIMGIVADLRIFS